MSGVPESFWTGVPIGRDVTRIVSDVNGLAAFVKPAGVLSHPNQSSDQPKALVDARYTLDGEFYEWRDAAGAVIPRRIINKFTAAFNGNAGRIRQPQRPVRKEIGTVNADNRSNRCADRRTLANTF